MEAYKPWFSDLEYVLKRGYFTEVAAIRAMGEYMDEVKKLPDVVVCANDNMAFGVCKKLKMLGYHVPKDVIVTGFDGIPAVDYYFPKLTTCRENTV